jgi:hypothetical protein
VSAAVDRQVREMTTGQLGRLLARGTVEQLRAAGARMHDRDALVRVAWEPFDLPRGYVQLWFESGFTCGIAPDGSVSS